MNAEIISIGDELLIGQVIDSNSAWIAEKLTEEGIRVVRITSISDQKGEIFEALDAASQKADLVMMTGGLGPTADDITKPALCEYFDTELEFYEETYQYIVEMFRKRNFPMTESNRNQAMLPKDALHLNNSQGTAKGMWFEKDGKVFISMPGVPFEMKAIVAEEAIPAIRKRFQLPFIYKKTVMTHGLGESFLAERIKDWESALPQEVKLAYLPQPGIVRMRLSASGTDKEKVRMLVESEVDKLLQLIPELVFAYDDQTMEETIGILLKDAGKNLTLAESCTGGYLSHLITSVPGSSSYYLGSITAYAYDVKESLLDVSHQSLLDVGAVSEEVIRQMAEGARKKLGSDYALATSGIAGPDGGTEEKPVGTIWIALAGPNGTKAKLLHLSKHRFRNIRMTAISALNMLRMELIQSAEKQQSKQ